MKFVYGGFLVPAPDAMRAANPYGAAFVLARRAQLGFDPDACRKALDVLNDESFAAATARVLAPERRALVVARVD